MLHSGFMSNALNKATATWTSPTEYEVSDLPLLGPIVIHWVGEENMYFTLGDGSEGYVKID